MSRSTNCTFTCPCGEVYSSPIYEYVNIAQNPQLRYTVLAGLLNVATCPMCGRRSALARPFIYSDPAQQLLAYVHPRADAPQEARQLILEKLRSVYVEIDSRNVEIQEETAHGNGNGNGSSNLSEMPPLRVIFGLDSLNELINTSLSQDEKLGRLALSTQSRDSAERGQMFIIARKLASEMQCQVEVEDLTDEYTVWLYGSRRQIGALMRELAPRG
ncbi:MAG TPA: CpXC domain-containing protein [Ktedonobacteraceae bacterium]|nr:CpXC domain-containing protein [Ktedonobacteraceae bacterium]